MKIKYNETGNLTTKNLGYMCYFYLVKVIEKCEDCLLSSTKYLLGIVSEHY